MNATKQLYYLTRREIDDEKWDNCIRNADNGLIYSYTFYLDALCEHWSAIILNDYEAVMPLPWKKKWGIRYLCSIPFIAQLGISGTYDNAHICDVLKLVQDHFSYGDIFFNERNLLPPEAAVRQKTNFVLAVNKTYAELMQSFSSDLKKNIKQAEKQDLLYCIKDNYHEVIRLFRSQYSSKIEGVTSSHYDRFSVICSALKKREMIAVRTINDNTGKTLASGIFFKDAKRIYNVMNVTPANERKTSANHFLLASVIKEFSETGLLFDFEGSDLPGVKAFYLNFKPECRPYFHYHFNHLPFPLRLLKK